MKWPYRPILLLTLLITTACKPSDPEQARPTIPAELASLNADQLNAKAMEFHKTGNYEESARHFEYATIRDSQYYKGYFNMACAYSLLKREGAALKALNRALALNPAWVQANLNDADLAWLRSQPGFAEIVSAGEGSVVGSKICRLPPGPHDTKYYRIRLDEGGRISGEGSISGATGMLEFTDGQWREQGDSIQLQLRFEGMRSEAADGGYRQVKASEVIELVVPVARLKQAGECYEVE
ncbi:MAG: hypothetical protein F9K24_05830 [Leptonema illini]|jgi:tetratricopeptide (TPR) repeat protein|uniref:Tetratricopeptide repeat protein n=1 Tax=Leptonema illini TaxID=183 RepID=A0A833LY08_9LEPT|nr:MAG: hypothetical protein F9K24_05830 [Leptonema illini]PKL33752.1 MAG: hypothetical protein CVV45_06320 [Spirochaetae bacterium HGW-Spirochaetae-10]